MWESLKKHSCAGKTVLVRADFNIPLEGIGAMHNDFRISKAAPTVAYLLSQGARVVLMTHLGEPQGPDPKLSTKHLIPIIKRVCNVDVVHEARFDAGAIQAHSKDLNDKRVVLFENLRFHPGEVANDMSFARLLASGADMYVNDAFGAAHRAHASVSAITKFLPSYAGLLMEKEVEALSHVFDEHARPVTFVVGGGKATTKAAFLKNISDKADVVAVGGVLGNIFLASKGIFIGASVTDVESVSLVKDLTFRDGQLVLPLDAIVSEDPVMPRAVREVLMGEVKDNEYILDVGKKTLAVIGELVARSKTVVWNGPLGRYEVAEFAKGTRLLAQMLAQSKAKVIIGGGDLTSALYPFIEQKCFYHVSTGGGAMLEFLSAGRLPALEALGYYS